MVFCAIVEPSQIKGLENGDKIDVSVSGTDHVYSCKIISGAENQPGVQKRRLCFNAAK